MTSWLITNLDLASKILLPFVAVVVGVGLAVWKYLYELSQKKRENRLHRVTSQLKELYGPLYALVEASEQSGAAFFKRFDLSKWRPRAQQMPEEDEPAWRAWICQQSQTINQRIYQLITDNADLYLEPGMPPAFRTFIAHYMQYKEITARWDEEDFNVLFAAVPYPELAIAEHVQGAFTMLRQLQEDLLAGRRPGRVLLEKRTPIGAQGVLWDADSPP